MLAICIDTKAIGITIAFTALATALNFIRIPVPYMPTFYYQMGDIALVVGFLLFGFRIGLTIAVLNMIATMTIFLGPGGVVGAPNYLVSVLTMMAGVLIFEKFVKNRISQTSTYRGAKPAVLCTIFAILTMVLLMLSLDYTIYSSLVSITSGLSVIPTSYCIATQVSKRNSQLLQTPFNNRSKVFLLALVVAVCTTRMQPKTASDNKTQPTAQSAGCCCA